VYLFIEKVIYYLCLNQIVEVAENKGADSAENKTKASPYCRSVIAGE
jgi:hypothetical protein